jgi:hypothetical protein
VDLLFPTSLPSQCQDVLKEALDQFMDHTFRSTTVVESVKARALARSRLFIYLYASRAALGPNGPLGSLTTFSTGTGLKLRYVEMGRLLRSWVYSNDEGNVLCTRSNVSHIIASAEERNSRWLALQWGVVTAPCMNQSLS